MSEKNKLLTASALCIAVAVLMCFLPAARAEQQPAKEHSTLSIQLDGSETSAEIMEKLAGHGFSDE